MIIASPLIAVAGILAIAIPIVMHFFFRRRQQPIQWAAMDLLRVAVTRTTNRRHLEKLLLLIVRCLIVAAAGLAVAGPLIKKPTDSTQTVEGAPRELVLVVDDGVSQQITDSAGEAFAMSKQQALDAIDQLNPGDAVGIICAAGAQPLVWPPSRDLAAARSTLESTKSSSTPSDITAALELAASTTRTVGVLSAFRRGSLARTRETTTIHTGAKIVVTPPSQVDVTNVQLVACEPQARGPSSSRGGIPLRLRLAREGENLHETRTNIDIALDDGNHTSLRVEWKEGQIEAVVESAIVVGTTRRTEVPLRASITDQDAQMADNTRFAVVATSNTIRVGVIDRTNADQTEHGGHSVGVWVERALAPTSDGDIETETIDPTSIDLKRCQTLDAIILVRPDIIDATGWSVLSQCVVRGKVLVVIPPAHSTSGAWSDGLLHALDLGWTISREPTTSDPPLTIINESSENVATLLRQLAPELQDLTQPVTVNRWFVVTTPASRGERVLALSNGSPLIAHGTPQGARGSVILFCAPPDLEWTNLPAKPLMVPLIQECVRQAIAQVDHHRGVGVGDDRVTTLSPASATLQLVMGDAGSAPEESRALNVSVGGSLSEPITIAGVYSSMDTAKHPLGLIVANIDVAAASTKRTTIEELTAEFKEAAISVSTSDFGRNDVRTANNTIQQPQAKALDGHSLAIWFFCAVILFLLLETWMARRSSVGATATQSTNVVR